MSEEIEHGRRRRRPPRAQASWREIAEYAESTAAIFWTICVAGVIVVGSPMALLAWLVSPDRFPLPPSVVFIGLVMTPFEVWYVAFLNRERGREQYAPVIALEARYPGWLKPLASVWWLAHVPLSMLAVNLLVALYRGFQQDRHAPHWVMEMLIQFLPVIAAPAAILYVLLAAGTLPVRSTLVPQLWRGRWFVAGGLAFGALILQFFPRA